MCCIYLVNFVCGDHYRCHSLSLSLRPRLAYFSFHSFLHSHSLSLSPSLSQLPLPSLTLSAFHSSHPLSLSLSLFTFFTFFHSHFLPLPFQFLPSLLYFTQCNLSGNMLKWVPESTVHIFPARD